jgi:S1-C subfamily serine protease
MGLNYIDLENYFSIDQKIEGVKIVKNANNISIEKNGPADIAKLQEGDIIYSIDNIELDNTNKLNSLIQKYKKGDNINISYLRDGKKNNTNLILDEY